MLCFSWGSVSFEIRITQNLPLEFILIGFAEKGLGIMVEKKLNMNQQYALAANCILGLICKTAASKPRE